MSGEKKRILAVYFTQTGQLRAILESVLAPLQDQADFEVSVAQIVPAKPYPFPWPFWRFFNTFPETVYEDYDPVTLSGLPENDNFDLIVLAYSVWFLSPSLPTVAWLNTPQAAHLLKGKRVVTLIGCRNMWLMAQERMKQHLARLGATLCDNIVLTDDAHAALTFISTPLWMLTGKRGPFLGGRVPPAGVPAAEIKDARRFGEAIARALRTRPAGDFGPMLKGLGAVRVNERLIGSEKVAKRSFLLWGALLRALGGRTSWLRYLVLAFYIAFLVTLILTIVPLLALLKMALAPLTRAQIMRQKAYFAQPSGEGRELASKGPV